MVVADSKQKTILVAEDEPSLLNILCKRVQSAGFSVISAKDGEEALKKASKNMPDALLIDIIMPKKNGFDVIEQLKIRNPNLPIMVITNLESPQDQLTGEHLGVYQYVLKSNTSMRELQRMLVKMLK